MLPRSSSQPRDRTHHGAPVLASYPSLPPSSAQPRSRRAIAINNGTNHGSSVANHAQPPQPQHGANGGNDVTDSPYQRHVAMIPPPQRIPARSAPSVASRASSISAMARPHTGHGIAAVSVARLAGAAPTIAFAPSPSAAAAAARPTRGASNANVHQLLAPSPVPRATAGVAVPYTTSSNTGRYVSPSAPSLASTLLAGVPTNVSTPRASNGSTPAVNQPVPSLSSTSRIGVATAPSYVVGRNGAPPRVGSGRRRDPSTVAALEVTPKIGSSPSHASASPWIASSMPSAAAHRAALAEEKQSQLSYAQQQHANGNGYAAGNGHAAEAKEWPASSQNNANSTSAMRAVSAARRTRVPVVTPGSVAASIPSLQTISPSSQQPGLSPHNAYANHYGAAGNGYAGHATTAVATHAAHMYAQRSPSSAAIATTPSRQAGNGNNNNARPSSGLAGTHGGGGGGAHLLPVNNGMIMHGSRPTSSASSTLHFGRTVPLTPNAQSSAGTPMASNGGGRMGPSTPSQRGIAAVNDDFKFALTMPSPNNGSSNGGNGNGYHAALSSPNSLNVATNDNNNGNESSRDTGRSSSRTSSRSSSPGGIIDVAVSEDANPRYRPTMEDAHVIQFDMGNDKKHVKSTGGSKSKPKHGYFAIYDGHGGRAAVDYISANLHKNVEKELAAINETSSTTPHANVSREAEAFHRAFLTTDQAMAHESRYQETGATVAAALIRPSKSRKGGRDLFVANAGDSRVVLATSIAGGPPTAMQLTHDHRPVTPGEIDRVRKAGGAVIAGRVNGQLAVSRALGDHALKRHGVSAVPHQTAVALEKQHKFVIVGCDGLWDVMTDQEAVQAVAGMKSAKKMSDKLVRMAMSRGTTDNVSVMAIRLRDD